MQFGFEVDAGVTEYEQAQLLHQPARRRCPRAYSSKGERHCQHVITALTNEFVESDLLKVQISVESYNRRNAEQINRKPCCQYTDYRSAIGKAQQACNHVPQEDQRER